MKHPIKRKSGKFSLTMLILLAVCIFGQSSEAQTSIYIFDSDQSTVVQTGGFAGVHETYPVDGQFRLSVDFGAGTAFFEQVDANLLEPTGFLYIESLGDLFNMTELACTVVDDTTIEFQGKTNDDTNTDVHIQLTLADDSVYLSGQTIPPPNSADLFIFTMDAVAHRKYAGGTGEPNNPYLIYTAEQMNTIGTEPNDWDKHFKLMADIDLSPYTETEFNIIGTTYENSFIGVFEGNNHTISNFSCKTEDVYFAGLFGRLRKGIVKDLILINPEVKTLKVHSVGSLVGMNIDGTISGCSVHGGSVTGEEYVGGLVGDNGGTIINCGSSCIVDGNSVGGLVGYNVAWGINSVISMCYSSGTVSGQGPVGGLVGQNGAWVLGVGEMLAFEGQIDNCYSTCNVNGNISVGGLVGFNQFGTINQCYSNGIVSGNEKIGGLIGENNARVNVCFWDVETSGLTSSDAGIGKTTVEMQTIGTFISWGACGQFWTIDEGRDYPHLAWENMPGEFIARPSYGGGTGSTDDPYLIYSAEQLNMLGLSFCDWDKYFKLMANIDLSDYRYDEALIAQGGWYEGTPFTGVFDGNGHTISHLSIIGEDNLGLFGYLGSGAEVRDLGVLDVNIVGSDIFVGSLAGYSEGNLIRCYSSGTVNGDWSVGGLVGASWEAINQCHSSCIVTGNDRIGGLVGANNDGVITQCYSTGEISGRDRVGGLVGDNGGNITSSYSTSAVSGDSDVGGLVGYNYKGSIATSYSTGTVIGDESVGGLVGCNGRSLDSRDGSIITACYSTSMVIGNEDVGGLVGNQNYSRITASFWDMETSSQITSAGGIGITTAKMQNINTFINAGWDFVDEIANGTCDYWQISPSDYPRLRYLDGDSPIMPEGLGTAQEPYLIRDACDLGTVWFKPIAHYRLEASLDLSGIIWSMAVVPRFGGTFDGNGYVISNLQIQGGSYLGLFGELGPEAELLNLGLEAVNVNGDWYVGGLVGLNVQGSITNCYSTGTVTGNNFRNNIP